VFGSVASDDADEASDVDFMVNMRDGSSLFDLMGFQQEVKNLLHREVDVVEIEGIKNPLRRRYMLEDARPL
jgi:predicted nucleotidyltransferase